MNRETAVSRLRDQAKRERNEAAHHGRMHGAEYVLNTARYQTVRKLVALNTSSQGDHVRCIDKQLWDILGDDSAWYVEHVKELDLPSPAYAEAFIESAIDTWTDIRDEVEG